jgi:hypothetical protein
VGKGVIRTDQRLDDDEDDEDGARGDRDLGDVPAGEVGGRDSSHDIRSRP